MGPERIALAGRLIRLYGDWLVRHRDVTDFDDGILRRGIAKLRAEAASLPGDYASPGGTILLAFAGGEAVGCGALRPIDARTAELKRVFVRPSARGLGVGRAVTVALLDRARSLGYDRVVLDTLSGMTAAIALYRGLGFREIAPYWDSPYSGSIFMELRLRDA